MNRVVFYILIIGITSLPACTSSFIQAVGVAAPKDYDPIAYYSWVSMASSELKQQEKERLQARISHQDVASEAYVQLALLTAQGATQTSELHSAIDLLERFEANIGSSSVRSDYEIFADVLNESLRHSLSARTASARVKLLEQERESLREQIEALTNIEQQINLRETARDVPSDVSQQ